MRTGNLIVGLLQMFGGVALSVAALTSVSVPLIALYALAAGVNGAMGGRLLAVALFGTRRDQWAE